MRRRFFAICEKPEGGGADNRPPAVRGLKHESNKKYLGMSSKVPPLLFPQINWLPQAGMRSRSHSRKKQGSCGSEKCVHTIFCKDATMAQKTNRKQSSKSPFLLDTFVTSAMNGITISDCQEHTHMEILTWLRACGRNLIRSSPDVSF